MSINTLDERFKNDMDNASSIKERLKTLKKLHEDGIYTVDLFDNYVQINKNMLSYI